MRYLSYLIPIALSASLGCSGTPDGDIGPDAGRSDTPAAVRDVTGSQIDTYLTTAGPVQALRDLSATTIAAHVSDGSGGYETISGTGQANGTFELLAVPEGSYLLQVGTTFVETTSSSLDLGRNFLGRPDAPFVTAPGTTLTFDVDGLSPFQDASIDVHAPNAGNAVAYGIAGSLTPELAADATAVTGVFDWADGTLPSVIEADKGDVSYMVTLEGSEIAPGTNARVVTQFAELPAIQMVPGTNVDVVATLVDAPADQTLAVSIDPADWAAIEAELGPSDFGAFAPGLSMYINEFDEGGDLSLIELAGLQTDGAFIGTLNYANPFPTDWKIAETVSGLAIGFIDPPANTTIGVSIAGTTAPLGTYVNDAKPQLGVVGAPQIDGADLRVPQSSDATPTISWTAPALGTPSHYSVRVRELGQGTRGRLVAAFTTTSTSVDIPEGLLTSGQQYFFELAAVRTTVDSNSAPLRVSGFDRDDTQIPSAVVTIQ